MEGELHKYIVTEQPPWYFTPQNENVFSCDSTQGLFDRVVTLMIRKQEELSEGQNRYKSKTLFKIIRNMVIKDLDTMQQKPSLPLLLALMDLVDMEGGNDFESIASVDKAGVKHVLLAYRNYMSFYIPNKDMICATGKKVVPVVTQYSEKHQFFHYDKPRSMVGTYVVSLPSTTMGEEACYFVQEVLYVPGPESLDLLKVVTQNKFAFWDMSLEVPTHPTALTPSFQQIQPCQLLRAEDKFLSTQSNKDALVSHVEEIHPMCCVVGTGDIMKKMRDSRLDCFTEDKVICKLTNFHYENGGTRTVYFRRSSKVVYGKRGNMVPVVTLRQEQRETPELYVSTTLRFFRAVKRSCIKGNGELVTCWNDTLKEFQRDSFIIGSDMYQEIQNPALTGFIKRVNPNSWCNYLPGHLESMIEDPIMIEVAELAIKLMDSKIPNAFAVAELLHCPIKKVQTYLKAWKMYSSDQMFRTAVLKTRGAMIENQMRLDWEELSKITLSYMQQKHGGDTREAAVCAELLKSQSPDVATKEAQKTWQSLIKHDVKSKDKVLAKLYSSAKVLFLKRRTYQNKLKKVMPGEGDRGDLPGGSSSSRSTKSQEAHVSSKCVASELKEDIQDRAMADIDEKDDRLFSIVTPDPIPVSTWLKNLSSLLLSEPWLNGDALRREAVCTLLGLENNLLDKRHRDILRDWVINNRTVVYLLQRNKLQDRLSAALVHCLETTSTDNWRGKILLSFQGTQDQLKGHSEQLVAKPLKSKIKKSHVQKSTAGEGAHSSSKSDKKAHRKQAHSPHHEYSYMKDEDLSLGYAGDMSSEMEEGYDDQDDTPGEDIMASMDYDNAESLDDYDYSDDFIDDGPIEEMSSSEQDEDLDTLHKLQVEKRGKKTNRKKVNRKHVNKGRKEETRPCKSEQLWDLLSSSEGGEEEEEEEEEEDKIVKPYKKPVKRIRLDKNKGKVSGSNKQVKEIKETSEERSHRQDKVCSKEKQEKRDKRAKPVKKYTRGTFNVNLSDSEISDYEEEVEPKRICAPEIKNTYVSTIYTDSDSDGVLLHKKTQKGKCDNTVRPKLRKIEASPEKQAVRVTNTFQQEPISRKRKRVEKLDRVYRHHADHSETFEPTSATSASNTSSSSSSSSSSSDDEEKQDQNKKSEKQEEGSEEDRKKKNEEEGEEDKEEDKHSDLDLDLSRPDSRTDNLGCSEPETDSGKKEYIVCM